MFHKLGTKHHAKVHKVMRGAGYRVGGRTPGSKNSEKEIAADAVHKHESHMHPGKAETHLKDGGKPFGKKSHKRLDKANRNKVNVNVVVPKGAPATPMPIPVPMGGARGPVPPMPMAPAGAAPAGGPVPPMKKGGACYKNGGAVKMTAGAASGEGRLEKEDIQAAKRKGKK